MKLLRYEFSLVMVGYGKSVDEAFNNVLNSLKEDPEATIVNEVVYTVVNNDSCEVPEDETPT